MTNESVHLRIQAICDELRSNPVFHLSLHSKELFHSNVLAWFCATHPQAASQALGQWVGRRDTSTHRVQRERNNLDLVIELPGLAPVVVENKVFAPPDDEQLERYSAGGLAGLEKPELLLLSLGRPNWSGSKFITAAGLEWRYLSYRDLAAALADVIDAVSGFDGELVRRYVEFVMLLQDLVDATAVPTLEDPVALDLAAQRILQAVRLHDGIAKLRARSVVAAVARSMDEVGLAFQVRFDANFTNGSPLIEAFVSCDNGDRIGWQYQGGQWRLAVMTDQHSGRTPDLCARREEYVAGRYAGWFDFAPLEDVIGRTISKVPSKEIGGGFNRFSPNFVYRYRAVAGLTLREVAVLARHYLLRASDWVPSSPTHI